MRVGYVRVSTADQNDARQVHELDVEKLFIDRASGKSTSERPQLAALLEFVREGDLVIVHSMDRLARNLDDLRALVRGMNAKGVQVQFLTEHLTFTGDDSPMSNLLLSVMGAFAEFERALIRERQREGIAQAKKMGVYKGRGRALSLTEAAQLREALAAGESKAEKTRSEVRHQPPDCLPLLGWLAVLIGEVGCSADRGFASDG